MKNINEWKQWARTHPDVLIDLLRIYLGVALFAKGVYFLSHRSELEQLLAGSENQAFAQAAVAHGVIPIHIAFGLLLAVGLLTRIAALLQIPILIGAVLFIHLPQMMLVTQRQSLEFSLLVLFLLALIFVHGPGRWSLDFLLFRKQNPQLQAQSSG